MEFFRLAENRFLEPQNYDFGIILVEILATPGILLFPKKTEKKRLFTIHTNLFGQKSIFFEALAPRKKDF